MRKFISILSMAMMLVCCVFAMPATASAATTPTYDSTVGSEAVYANGTDIDIYPADDGSGNLLIVWEYDDNGEPTPAGSMQVPAATPIYAGSKDADVDANRDEMYIAQWGVTITELNLCGGDNGSGGNHKVNGVIGVEIDDEITTLNADGNDGVGFFFWGGEIKTLTGVTGRTDVVVAYDIESGLNNTAIVNMGFDDQNNTIAKNYEFYLDAGDKGTFSNGDSYLWLEAWVGETLADNWLVSDMTPTPKTGYKFDGWYLDKEYTKPWDLEKTVVDDATHSPYIVTVDGDMYVPLYAKWVPVSHDMGANDMGGFMLALMLMTGAAAGITGGMLLMRKRAAARK